jgi:prepilin-type N-terminal cleavage/methylation domain-containing protein
MTSRKQSGFTLLELGIVLVIVLVAASVVLVGAVRAQASARTQAAVAVVRSAMVDAKQLRPDRNYANLTAQELIRAGKIPTEWQRDSATAIQGPWGGRLTLQAWAGYWGSGSFPNGFIVTVTGLDTETCAAMVTGVYPGTYGVRNPNVGDWAYLGQRESQPPASAVTLHCAAPGFGNALLIYTHGGRA